MLVFVLMALGAVLVTIGGVTLAPDRGNVRRASIVPMAMIALGVGLEVVALIELAS